MLRPRLLGGKEFKWETISQKEAPRRGGSLQYELRGTYQVASAATSGTHDCLELIQNQKSVHSQVKKQPAKITLVITKNTQPYIHIEEQKAAASFVGYQAHFRNDFLKEA